MPDKTVGTDICQVEITRLITIEEWGGNVVRSRGQSY
jgi:hypothetical protein